MKTRRIGERIQEYGKDTRWVVVGLTVLLAVLSAIYYLIQRSRDLPPDLATNKVLLLVLWYINVVLLLTIAFMLLRNVVKLLVERKHRLFGSKFKIKLVATYVLLSLIPALLLFVYGSSLLRGWIDDWFEESAFEAVAEQGFAVSEALDREFAQRTMRGAESASQRFLPMDSRLASGSEFSTSMQALLSEDSIHYLGLYDGTDFVHAVALPQAGFRDIPEPPRRFLLEALRKGRAATKIPLLAGSRGRLYLAAATDIDAADDEALIVAGALMPADLAAAGAGLIRARQGYRQLEVQKGTIKATYRLTFLMVTLLILLATSWVGLYLARRVTVPIEAVAEATRRLSEGNLDYRVEVPADDELGMLVQSFNSMTSDLKLSKQGLVEANLRLDEERALIRTVLEGVAAGVVSVDEDGRVLTCNRAAAKMLRQDPAAIVGSHVDEIWADRERGKLASLFLDDPGHGSTTQTVRLFLAGRWKILEAKVRPMRDAEGRAGGRVMVLEDLTELIQAQQRAAWHDAARRVAHQIKNPLTPIRLSAERILKKFRSRDEDFGEALEEGVNLIGNEIDTMKNMVDEFSQYARMRPPQPLATDMTELVSETVRLYSGIKPGVEVSADVANEGATALVDREQIKQVLVNLLDNAIEAVEAPGSVSVAVHDLNGALHIDVADTGHGIPESDREKLFLPHFSTKGRGTGLGLAIVHRIVNEHHGSIVVSPNMPRGTIFRIELPQA